MPDVAGVAQFPLVALLSVILFQSVRVFRSRALYLASIGWLINLAYIVVHVYGTKAATVLGIPHLSATEAETLLNGVSSLFFIGCVYCYSVSVRIRPSRYRHLALSFILIACVGWSSFGGRALHSSYADYLLVASPGTAVDLIAQVGMYWLLFRLVRRDYAALFGHGRLALWAQMLYAAIQLLYLFTYPDIEGPQQHLTSAAFNLGLASKALLLLGIMQLFSLAAAAAARSEADRQQMQLSRSVMFDLFHELNTPTEEIHEYVISLEQDLPSHGKARAWVFSISSAVERIRAIIEAQKVRLDAPIARFPAATPSTYLATPESCGTPEILSAPMLMELAKGAVKTTREETPKFRHNYAGNCCICADKFQVVQVLINILRNSYDSLSNGTGHIVLGVASEDALMSAPREKALGNVVFTIKDDGEGIPEEHLAKIFDEGFTTRPGDGRGRGMAVVRRLLEGNDGRIEVSSSRGDATKGQSGTEVRVIFPRVKCVKKREGS